MSQIGHGPVPERNKFKQKENVIPASNIQVFWHPHPEQSKTTGNGRIKNSTYNNPLKGTVS
jgi:hypothetical protein